MALVHTQAYKDNQRENTIFALADRLVAMKGRLLLIKSELLTVTAEVQADSGADADLKTLAIQADAFINNAKVTDYIDFVTSNLG